MSEPETETETPKPETETPKDSMLKKAAGRGEDAVRRLSDEIDRNERLHDVKTRLEEASKTVLRGLNLAPRDEVDSLKKEVAMLEKRLAVMESAAARGRATREETDAAEA